MQLDEAVTWRRADGWVHRVLTGKVLLAAPSDRQRELVGATSIVWIALDEPATLDLAVARIADALGSEAADPALLASALEQLVAAGVVVPVRGEPDGISAVRS